MKRCVPLMVHFALAVPKRLPVFFYKTEGGGEPVREWLNGLPYETDRKRIGEDIRTIEFGWPLGMPFCRPMGGGLFEVRTPLDGNRVARVLFGVDRRGRMVLLHGFVKKSRRTPDADLDLAQRNRRRHERSLDEKND